MADGTISYVDEQIKLTPGFLQKKWGLRWSTSFGLTKDALRDSFEIATIARFTAHAPDDALPQRGGDVGIERGPSESLSTYRARLLKPFSRAEWLGTDKGVVDELVAIGFGPAHIKRNNQWNWDGNPGNPPYLWARMWPIFEAPSTWSPPPVCGAPGFVCGAAYPPVVCGITGATHEELASIRRAVHVTSSSHVLIPKTIALIAGASLCGDGAVCGDGTVCGVGSVAYLRGE